jgi:pyrroline-5-carboxylate reductase
MGTALAGGAIRAGVVAPEEVTGTDPQEEACRRFREVTGARTTRDIAGLRNCDTFLLCTKPQHAIDALRVLRDTRGDLGGLLISVAAGVTMQSIEQAASPGWRVIRCMPNTPALIGKGAAAFCAGTSATRGDAATAQRLLGAVGTALEVPEPWMDAVTGLSGSGPAFAYLFIESLAKGGEQNGLPPAEALALAAQTVLGAAAMVIETGQSPAALRDMVTSPGGTTLAGLAELERHGMKQAVIHAVNAATKRSAELGR